MNMIASIRPYVWAGATAVSAISSKYMLISSNYHYRTYHLFIATQPAVTVADKSAFYLLSLQLLVASIILTCFKLVDQTPVAVSAQSLSRLRATVILGSLSKNLKFLLSAVCLAIFFPLWTQAMLHFENPEALLMLMPLVTTISTSTLHLRWDEPASKWCRSRIGLTLVASFVIMFDDYRLTPNGLVFGILALLSLASAGWLYHAQVRQPDMDQTPTTQTSTLPAILMPLVVAAICYSLSDKAVVSVSNPDQKRMLYVNVVSSATSYVLGVQMLGHDVIIWTSGLTAFVLVGLASVTAHVLGVTSYLSWLQLLAFGVAVLCTSEQLFASTPYSMYNLAARSEEDLELVNLVGLGTDLAFNEHPLEAAGQEVVQPSPATRQVALWVINVILLTFMCATWMFSLRHNFSPSSIDMTSSMQPRLDRSYNPVSELDIVVSMFKEPPSAIKQTIEQLKRLPEISHRNPRLIVYTKNPSANVNQLLEQTGATTVIQLPNVGREGHTYLHHIVEQWENLAAQTFFLQADIHNPREFFPRVRDYYTSQTGMLSLGFSGQTCDCRECGDRFGWWDNTLVKVIWSQVMNETCTDQQMLMSYKGQFVASAARLRGNEQSLYKTLRTALEDPENLVHKEDYLQGRPDSMNAPFFGYTLERLWSVLLQCSEKRIAARCPTLLSGTRRGGSKEDCQCFDVS